ncbi:MAG: ribbon-helix-helix protein, CopG family [Ignavibacteriaceae bacterium]
MTQIKVQRNTFFNFRLRPDEMEKIRQATLKLNYVSYAEFIRRAIREKIERDLKNG